MFYGSFALLCNVFCYGVFEDCHGFCKSQGWTLFEILRYAPQHNWIAYEEALKRNPVLAKMVISGVVYSVGDWIAQVSLFSLFSLKLIILCESFR